MIYALTQKSCCKAMRSFGLRAISPVPSSKFALQTINVSVRVQVAAPPPSSSTLDPRIVWPDASFVMRQIGDDPISAGIYGTNSAALRFLLNHTCSRHGMAFVRWRVRPSNPAVRQRLLLPHRCRPELNVRSCCRMGAPGGGRDVE